jgi:hypothetical protein
MPQSWFIVVSAILIGLALVVWVVIYPRTIRGGPLSIYQTGSVAAGPFRFQALCGVRYPLSGGGTMTVTMPLARAACDSEGIVVSPSSPLTRFALPTWRFKWNDIARAEAVGAMGVNVKLKQGNAHLILTLMGPRNELLEVLSTEGIEVDPSPS